MHKQSNAQLPLLMPWVNMNIINKIDTYLNESKIETLEEFITLVKRDCSAFLKEIKPSKHFLYRE